MRQETRGEAKSSRQQDSRERLKVKVTGFTNRQDIL